MNVENIAVSFLADEGVFLPAAESGSTIFIDQIKAGERVVKKMTFATKYDAVPKSYLLCWMNWVYPKLTQRTSL